MKKIISILLVISMLMLNLCTSNDINAASIWDVDFAYQTLSVSAGQTFDYKMMVTSNATGFTDVSFANVYSTFSKAGFTITGVKNGSLISSGNMSVGSNYDNIQISGVSVGANVTGELFIITLKAPAAITKNTTYTIPVSISKVARGSYNLDVDAISGSITVNASATPLTYTVSYNVGAGTGAPDNQIKEAGKNLTLASSPIPTRSGYDFKGWDTSSEAKTVVYSLGGTYTKDENLTLYAVWTPKTYNVFFDANGGTGAPSKEEKIHDVALTLPTTVPTKEGYVFKGWATSSSSTTVAYAAGGSFTENKTTTLYAVYSVKNYYIRYDLNGGTSAAIPEQGKTNNVDTNLTSTIPTREGYDFLGWSKDKSATSATYAAGAKYSENVDNYLYAVWKLKTYSVTYDANGGKDAPAAQTKKYFDNLILSSTKPTREGYDFKGWATSKTATTATVQPGATYSKNENVTYYAVWSLKTYAVSYNANGGSGAPSAQTKKYFDNLTLSTTKPTRTGYNFLGWATSKTATKAEYQAGATYTKNEKVTLYAVWSIITYSVTYDAKGGSNGPSAQTKEYGKTLTLSSTKPTKTGYTFQGWTTTDGSTTVNYAAGASYTGNAALKLYAVWKADTYKVTFDANGGANAPAAQTKTYAQNLTLSSTKPTRTGYTFQGWAKKKDSTTVDYLAGAVYSDNSAITLYAVWKINTYTVTFDANGGVNAPKAQTKTYGQNLTITSEVPTRQYYTFVGWATSAAATKATVQPGGTYTSNKNITYYAVWKRNTYTVKYDYNLEDGEAASGSISNQTKNEGEALTLSTTIPTRTDYKFIGWSTDFASTVAEYSAGDKYTKEGNTVLYAIWVSTKVPTYTITYDANGGSFAPAKQTKVEGTDLTLTDVKAEKTGLEFIGWNTDKNAEKALYRAGASYTKDENVTLYAIYREPLRDKWDFVDGIWYYYNADNKLVTGWMQIGSIWYYFYEDGAMATGWTNVNGSYFYMDKDGVMLTGWQFIGRYYYYFNSNGYMVTGWLYNNNQWYYLNPNGDMHIGWLKDGNYYYYFASSGEMKTGWVKDGNNYYYMDKNGQMITGWLLDGNKYYYFKDSGEMATGWVKVGNYYYYLKSSGEMATGWVQDGKYYYYMNKDGQMVTNTWLEYAKQWYYFGEGGEMATGWKLIGKSYYYFDKTGGSMVYSKTIYVDGKYYTFNSQGVCVNP